MNKIVRTLSVLCAFGGLQLLPNESVTQALHAELDRIEAECAKIAPVPAPAAEVTQHNGPALCFKGARDVDLTIDGLSKIDYARSWNTETLNNASGLDRAIAYNGRIELGTTVAYGKEKYGKAAIEMGVRLRQQYQAGRFDKVLKTNGSSVKIADAVCDVAPAKVNATIPWFKHAMAKVYLNALTDRAIDTDHFLKAGLFEYQVGRGIAYGSSYGTPKAYLGVYSGSNNFAPFGILLNGEIIKNRLDYEFYFARLEAKGSDFAQANERTKTHIVGNKRSGAAGSGNSNDVFIANIKGHYDAPRFGDVKTHSFVVYNNALDQKIEMVNDCQSKLFSVGTGFNYEKGNFEFGGEVAFNLGTEYVYNIDRNVINLVGMYPGQEHMVTRAYSHVTVNSETDTLRDGAKAPVVSTFKTVVDNYEGNESPANLNFTELSAGSLVDATAGAGEALKISEINDYVLANTANRFRPAYKNKYAGWMGVLDASYNWKPANLKLSAAIGHASGDANPHADERDKTYRGFVGINENYAGTRVKSVLAMGASKLQAPLTANPNTVQLFDNSFADMTYVGGGLNWRLPKRDLDLSANALAFFKDKRSLCYVYNEAADTGGYGSKYARRFFGVELNTTFEWKLLPGLSLSGEFAVFLPGSFYTDVRGLPVNSAVVKLIDEVDSTGYSQAVPRLGTDPQIALNVGLQYKF